MSVQLVGVNFTYPGAGAGVFDVNLEIQPGELVACIGASGSGKTTLLKMVAGFEFPDRGQVIIDGLDVTRLRPRERQLGVVFQNYALFPLMTATDNVAYPLKVRHVAREERLRRARETLERVGLALLAAPGSFIILLFFVLPLVVVSAEAFTTSGAFMRVFSDSLFWRGLWGTIVLSLTAASLSLLAGFGVSYQLARMSEARRTALMFFISLPLTFSGLIVAYGFILAFGRAGFVTLVLEHFGLVDAAHFAGFIYSPTGLAFAYCYYLIPRVVLVLLPVLLNFEHQQILAAQSLGAGRLRAMWDVLIPATLPSAVVAFCLVAAVAFGAYGTALALVGTQVNILPLLLYSKVSDVGSDFPAAAALSVVLLAGCTLIMAVGEMYATRRTERHR